MKRLRIWASLTLLGALFFLLWASASHAEERDRAGSRFSLKLTGGARYAVVGDLNEYLDSFNQQPDICGKVAKVANWASDW